MEPIKSDHDLIVEIHTNIATMAKTVGNHERRLRFLERWFWMASGVAVVVGYLLRAALR